MGPTLCFQYSLNEIRDAALKILHFCKPYKVWLFYGEMGAGKTTLIKSLAQIYTVKELVNSPTFSLVNEYSTPDGEIIYHFDFYRIQHESEALDIGADEYFYSGNFCWVEWPSKVPSLIPKRHIEIHITAIDSHKREIFVKKLE